MNKQTVVAEVRTKVRIPQGPSKKILEATRVHWELVEVVDFYGKGSELAQQAQQPAFDRGLQFGI